MKVAIDVNVPMVIKVVGTKMNVKMPTNVFLV